MATNKKYYWLRLKRDFFTDKRIKKLRKTAGGDTYTIIYLKMQLLSLQDEGVLYFDHVEDTFEEEIALQIDEDVEDVRITIGFLINSGLLKVEEDNSYTLIETQKCIGSESESKERVAAYRQRKVIRDKIKLQYVQIISNEMIRTLTDGKIHFIDNKRYGGNAEYVYDLAMCRCENCGETNTEKFVIHHNNGYSNDLDDLYLLCPKCHKNVEVGNIKNLKHNRRNYEQNLLDYNNQSVTCNTDVTKCNTEKEKEKEKKKEIDINKDKIKKNNKEMFEEIWRKYPNKKGKDNAYKSFEKALKNGVSLEEINQGLENYNRYIEAEKIEQKYIKHGSTWFNQHCWEDDYTIKKQLTTRDIEDKIDFSDVL